MSDAYLQSMLLQGPVPTITQSVYESTWKPAGWKLIIIGPTSTWRTEWGAWESIRDIVQNCLDEVEGYKYGFDHDGLWIADDGKGVAVEDFLLGPPKLKPDYARGKYGEGMKIASLALLRLGHPVRVQTVGKDLWICFVQQQINGRVEQLAALWKPGGSRTGTRFHIIGYHDSAYPERFAVNLPRSLILAEVPSLVFQPKQRYNQLLRNEGMASGGTWGSGQVKGRIYARDIWLEDIASPFSYNLWGFTLAPDRHGPKDHYSLYQDMGRLWCGVNKVPLLKMLLKYITDPLLGDYTSYETMHLDLNAYMGQDPVSKKSYSVLMVENQKQWQAAWDEVVGKHTVLRTDFRYDGMVQHLSYRSHGATYGVREGLKLVIKTDEMLVHEMSKLLEKAERIPDNKLTPIQVANLNLARVIAEGFRGVGDVNAAIIPPASDAVDRTAGLYEFGTALIKISGDILESAQRTVGVMIHELGHHVAYKNAGYTPDVMHLASDLTEGHANAMEEVAGRVFRSLAKGQYDDHLSADYFQW